MNLEQQYRTGRFPVIDPDRDWLLDRVAEIVRDDRHRYWGETKERMQELLEATMQPHPDSAHALAVLGLSDVHVPGGLLAHTQARVNADPAHEAEYWEAMWVLRSTSWASTELRELLPIYADVLETQQRFRDAGWPEPWWGNYAKLWHTGDGTLASARAWHALGWTPLEVFTADITVSGRYVPLQARITLTHPPARTDSGVRLHACQLPRRTSNSARGH